MIGDSGQRLRGHLGSARDLELGTEALADDRPDERLGPCAPRIALTGILASQADEVARAYAPWCALRVSGTDEDWVLLSGVRA